jgi:hypothetical protein
LIALHARWADQLLSQPETGMGYQMATIQTKDGRVYQGVCIIGGTISSVQGTREIPFREEDIASIIVEHGR